MVEEWENGVMEWWSNGGMEWWSVIWMTDFLRKRYEEIGVFW